MTPPPIPNAAPPIDIAKTVEPARAAWAEGRADEAEMACRQVLAVWPGQTDATYLLGLMAYTYGNLDLAIAHVRQACEAPRAPPVYFSDFAEMCRQKGLLAEAEAAGRRAVALAPNFAAAWNNLGIVLQEALKLDESRLCLERALALEPNNAADAQQPRQHLEAPRPGGGSGEALERGACSSSRTTPRPTATSRTCSSTRANTTAPRPWRDAPSSSIRASPTPMSISPPSRPRAIATPRPCTCSTRFSPSRRGMRARSRRGR